MILISSSCSIPLVTGLIFSMYKTSPEPIFNSGREIDVIEWFADPEKPPVEKEPLTSLRDITPVDPLVADQSTILPVTIFPVIPVAS